MEALVNAGGKGSRMGRCGIEKPMQLVGGVPTVRRVVDALLTSTHIDRLLVSVSDNTPCTEKYLNDMGVETIRTSGDDFMGDLHEAFSVLNSDYVLTCPSDLPLLTTEVVDSFIEYFVPGETAIKLNYDKYLVDGEFPGIGVAIFGGPTWDAKLADGVTPDRHDVIISNVHLTGEKEQTIDLSYAMVNTGFSDTNSGGTAAIVDGAVVITGGFCYDGHMITFGEETVPGETEPGTTDPSTYLCMDLLLTTLSESTGPVNIRLYNNSYTASVGDDVGYIDQITVTAGTTATIKVKVDGYLVDGELPGFGVCIFGGPEWNTELSPGVYDRHSVVISNVRLEGAEAKNISLNGATIATGTNAGFSWANSGGMASIVDGKVVITDGFRYDAHEITFGEETVPGETEPGTTLPLHGLSHCDP